MGDTTVSLKDFLQERHFLRRNDEFRSAHARRRIEESQLLKTMRDTCAAINAEAQTVLVEEHHYLPPEPVVSSFAFIRGHTEYVMRLEQWGPKPSLVFAKRNWRDASANGLFRWFRKLARLEPLTVNIKCVRELEGDDASAEEIRLCFFYLLSGLSRAYIPSFKTRDPA
jgi:hypothetical protein